MNLPYISRLPSILLVPGVMAGTLDLAVRGRAPEYAIVRAVDASPSVKYAAEELRDFTERMTGVRLPIVEVGEATEGYRVRLDCHSKLPQVRQAKLGRTNSGRSYIVKKSTYD